MEWGDSISTENYLYKSAVYTPKSNKDLMLKTFFINDEIRDRIHRRLQLNFRLKYITVNPKKSIQELSQRLG